MGSEKSKSKKKKYHKHRKDKDRSEYKSTSIKQKEKTKHTRKRSKSEEDINDGFNVPIPKDLDANSSSSNGSRLMAPMTKEEWDKRQSVVRKVYDETTGRHRLIKGDGEVLEEIVSYTRHKDINKQATVGDGDYFRQQSLRNTK